MAPRRASDRIASKVQVREDEEQQEENERQREKERLAEERKRLEEERQREKQQQAERRQQGWSCIISWNILDLQDLLVCLHKFKYFYLEWNIFCLCVFNVHP